MAAAGQWSFTNASFTKSARTLAAANRCELVEREQLGALFDSFKWNGAATTPTQPKTGPTAPGLVESDVEPASKAVAAVNPNSAIQMHSCRACGRLPRSTEARYCGGCGSELGAA
jgi:hypothetical protein